MMSPDKKQPIFAKKNLASGLRLRISIVTDAFQLEARSLDIVIHVKSENVQSIRM